MNLTIHKVVLPLRREIKTAKDNIFKRYTILIEVNLDGYCIWGEAPGFMNSNYMFETHDMLWTKLLSEGHLIFDAIKSRQLSHYCNQISHLPIFKYALDSIACQLDAINSGLPLMAHLGIVNQPFEGTAMMGIHSTESDYLRVLRLVSQMGYKGIKLKVTPHTLPVINSILAFALDQFDYVAIDANGSFDASNVDQLKLIPNQVVLEQPVMDRSLLLSIIKEWPHYVLLDESVRSFKDLLMFQGLNVGVMLKPVCLGGLTTTIQMIHACSICQLQCGVSGYLDSGVGRYFQWLLAQHSNLTLRSDFVWSDYYFLDDICDINSQFNGYDQFPDVNRGLIVESYSF